MAGLLDAILGMSGQERTEALRQLGRDLEYYVPPELRGILGLAAEMTPSETLSRAGASGREMLAPDLTAMERLGSAGQMLSETAGVAAPMMVAGRAAMPAAQAIQEGLLGFSVAADDVGRRVVDRLNQPGPVPTMYSGPAGFADYLKRVNPRGVRVAAEDRPNLMMGDMYGMLPSGAKRVGKQGDVTFYRGKDGDFYATAFNPDVGEQDVVGYIMPRGDMTELAVVDEMQGQGIGGELQYLFRKENPDAPTGGLTEAGEKALRKTYERLSSEGLLGNALPSPRNEAEAMAKQVLEMRAAGRAGDVTEEMMAAADPQYMFANTPLPMDEASRMARARELGFDARVYHGSRDDITSMDPLKGSAEGGAGTLFSSDEARVANTYATKRLGSEGENVIPLLANVSDYGESGYKTPFPFNGSDVAIEQWLTGLDRFNRALDNSKTSYFENAIRSARNAGQAGTVIRQVEDDAVSSMRTMPSDVHITLDPTTIRSRFARFDPEFSHLRNLSAGVGGLGILSLLGQQEQEREQEIRQYLGGLL